MLRVGVLVVAALVVVGCGSGSEVVSDDLMGASTDPFEGARLDRPSDDPGPRTATGDLRDGPRPGATSSPLPSLAPSPTSAAEVDLSTWENIGFMRAVGGDVAHVTTILVASDGTIWAPFYGEDGDSSIAWSDDEGETWTVEDIPGEGQVKDLIELSTGTLLATGSNGGDGGIVWRRGIGGGGWDTVAASLLPNPQATTGWDLIELPDGSVLLGTDSLRNDPDSDNPSVHRTADDGLSWETIAELPGLGVLSFTLVGDGTVLAANEESAEHDDADAAGQAHVFTSRDGGETWDDGVEIPGANRVYVLYSLSDGGTVLAGTGIRGEVARSLDGGRSWELATHVPDGRSVFSDETEDATRVYSILELADGRIVVGTGNLNGDVFVTDDLGDSWERTGETGRNNVVWGIAQDADGVVWLGTGSTYGDVVRAG